jgi:hypothetical protein
MTATAASVGCRLSIPRPLVGPLAACWLLADREADGSRLGSADELTISYIETQQPLAARQKLLRKQYHFVCACTRCEAEAAGGAGALKLSYHSGGGARKAPASKRERRERREERAERTAAASQASSGAGGRASSGGRVDDMCAATRDVATSAAAVHVHVDLRVLLKLVPKAKQAPAAKAEARRRKGGAQPPTQVPTCSVRLRVAAPNNPIVAVR